MRLAYSLICFCLCLVSLLPAQSTSFIPDNQPAVGTCNAIPFGSGTWAVGYTYMARVPASMLVGSAATRLQQIYFAACSSGAWSCSTVRITIGHVPSPLPATFTFPTPTSLGSFLDQTTLFDSAAQGTFTWNTVQDTWAPFLPVGAGTSFCWNGVNDVGLFITFVNATVSFGGTCHRTNTEPYRMYATGYQAAVSTGAGASGLKMQLDFGACGPPLWETNSPASSLDINGVIGTGYTPAGTIVLAGSLVSINLASSNVGWPFDLLYVPAPSVSLASGGLSTPFGQIVNIDIASPQLGFINGFSFTTPFPGPFVIAFGTPPFPLTLSMQMINLDPSHPDGFSLSQGAQLDVP